MAFERVLVVDDNQFSRISLVGQISDLDYDVEWVESGEKALEILNTDRFDLVVTRLLMPVVDGWTLLESVRKLPRFSMENGASPPPFIYTTTDMDPSIRERAEHAGFVGGLFKPIEPHRLKSALRKGIALRTDQIRFHLTGSDASLLRTLAARVSMDPIDLVTLLVEEVALCGIADNVVGERELREFLFPRLRDNILQLPEKVA